MALARPVIGQHLPDRALVLRSATVEIAQRTAAQVAADLRALGRTNARHAIVQFNQPVDEAVRARMNAAGVQLQGYLGASAYIVGFAPDGIDAVALARIRSLTGAVAIDAKWKVHPMLTGVGPAAAAGVAGAAGAPPAHAVVGKDQQGGDIIGAYLLFHSDVDVNIAAEPGGLLARHAATLRDVLEMVNGAVIELPFANVAALAGEDAVLWIEPPLPRMSGTNDQNRVITQTNLVQAAPYNLDGAGVNALIYDGGTARATHQDFGGRLTIRDSSGVIDHATHGAGTIGGSGAASGGTFRGMAPAVTIQSYGFEHDGSGIFLYTNPGDLETDYEEAINTFGVDIANNGIGTNTAQNGFPCDLEGDYGVTDMVIDAIVRGSLGAPFRVVWATGNERGNGSCGTQYHTTAPPACAKNHITVGAMNSTDDSVTGFTSWGPTDDGRMKPDLSGPGCQSGGDGGVTSCAAASDISYGTFCSSSMACATTTGCCALLLQDFRAQFPGEPDPCNSTLKILLAQNADDIQNAGPDYQTGYGSIRIKDTIDFMRTGNFTQDVASQGEVVEFTVEVTPGTPLLKATLAWDDPPAVPLAAVSLVNDLDIVAIAPGGGATHLPWTLNPANPSIPAVQTAANHRDNLEQVLVNNPAAGTWTIRVIGCNVPQGPQTFSICAAPNLAPGPGVRITLLDDLPAMLAPGASASLLVRIVATGESLVPDSPLLHARYAASGAYLSIPLEPAGGNNYTATLPPPTCAATPEYYFSAEGTVSGVVTNPPTAPASVYSLSVAEVVSLVDETFEGAANGWICCFPSDSATSGFWVQADPNGTSAQPEHDHTPAPGVKCWFTGQGAVGGGDGDNDVDGGVTILVSPTFNLAGIENPLISYWRWYSNGLGGAPNSDVFRIQVTNSGGFVWLNVETIGPSGPDASGGWIFHEFNLASLTTSTNQVRMRFLAEDLGEGSLIEAAIDDFAITTFECTAVLDDCNENGIVDSDDIASGRSTDVNRNGVPDECERLGCTGDINGDDVVDVNDLLLLIGAWGASGPNAADLNGDSTVDVNDLLILIGAWGACPF